jgi:hypothetical protein
MPKYNAVPTGYETLSRLLEQHFRDDSPESLATDFDLQDDHDVRGDRAAYMLATKRRSR